MSEQLIEEDGRVLFAAQAEPNADGVAAWLVLGVPGSAEPGAAGPHVQVQLRALMPDFDGGSPRLLTAAVQLHPDLLRVTLLDHLVKAFDHVHGNQPGTTHIAVTGEGFGGEADPNVILSTDHSPGTRADHLQALVEPLLRLSLKWRGTEERPTEDERGRLREADTVLTQLAQELRAQANG